MKERLHPGLRVRLIFDGLDLGEFVYSGLWDTMHAFYPHPENPLAENPLSAAPLHDALPENPLASASFRDVLPESRRRYARRDLRGREFIQLPYTILADVIQLPNP